MTMASSSSSVFPMEWLLFCATAALFTWGHKRSVAGASSTESSTSQSSCKALQNSAFVFIKPHANTSPTQALVRSQILQAGLSIVSEQEIRAEEIDDKKLIDQHYYAIASKATIVPGKDIPVPKDKFQQAFGESYDKALKDNRIVNALEACKAFGCTPSELNDAWQQTTAIKFGGGFYCGRVSYKDHPPLYVFNAFFMSMRSKFVTPGTSIHCYEIEWNPAKLSWKDFRNQFLGPTDPADAPSRSVRRLILEQWQTLGLTSIPNKGDNGVHASASPLEGLAEKQNWLGKSLESEPFGKALLDAGISRQTLLDWSLDPRITLTDGTMGSVFDALEDLDVTECLAKMIELNDVNSNMI